MGSASRLRLDFSCGSLRASGSRSVMRDESERRRMPGDESKALIFDKIMAFLQQWQR
ncbi:MAG TPA: hypothetical protein VMX13_05735 [Sedimentisphaerales bacterium]|nr:hypothetical protein [Sedimentisphaerales bacterium]